MTAGEPGAPADIHDHTGEGAAAPDRVGETLWECGHALSTHNRAQAAACFSKQHQSSTHTASPPLDAICAAATARLWNGYIDAITHTRGPRLILSAADVRVMFELHHIAGGIVGR